MTQIFKKHITDNWNPGVKVMHRKRKPLNQEPAAAQKIAEDEMADFDRDMQADEAAE
jgi:hypothetical protein